MIGINASGFEFNSGTLPGRPWWDYPPVTSNLLSQFSTIKAVRIPFEWARLELTLGASFDSTFLALLQTAVSQATNLEMKVMLDMHNYGTYRGTVPTPAQFADTWRRIALAFKGTVEIFDLMNEPNNAGGAWPVLAQAAVDAIRTVDTSVWVCVEGTGWSGPNIGSHAFDIKDSTGHIYRSAHVYGDRYNSGTDMTWATAQAQGVTPTSMADKVKPFLDLCVSKGWHALIGECGVGNDDPAWQIVFGNFLALCQSYGARVYAWSACPWWGNYSMSLTPGNATMTTITKYNMTQTPDVIPSFPLVSAIHQCNENQTFTLNAPSWVFYGVDTRWAVRFMQAGQVAANNGVFGDPAYGTRKAAYILLG